MSKVNVPRLTGDDYQARWLWVNICRLLPKSSNVKSVIYEANMVKAFDDVAVFYKDGVKDSLLRPLYADFYQVKFHMKASGSITCQNLIDPEFINATSVSLLQRLRNVHKNHAVDGAGYRYYFYSSWNVHPDDPLARLVSMTDGHIDIEMLFEGGDRSEMGRIRSTWCNHLGLNQSDLRTILQSFHIQQGPSLEELNRQLNFSLISVGLEPVRDGMLIHRYDELTRKLLQNGITEFNSEIVEAICREEGLWKGRSFDDTDAHRIGIRSFSRWAEHLEDNTEALLCLLRYFDGRTIKSQDYWNSHVFPEVRDFLTNRIQDRRHPYHIHLLAHSSIAFAAGYCLDTKAGLDVAPVQPTASGSEVWRPNTVRNLQKPYDLMNTESVVGQGRDVALAISITHEISSDVAVYLARQSLLLNRVFYLSLKTHIGSKAVLDGDHAFALAQQIAQIAKTQRSPDEREGILHIFSSAPNSLLFFLGQLARGFGSCILYEYNFESNLPGAYQPSISFNL